MVQPHDGILCSHTHTKKEWGRSLKWYGIIFRMYY